MAALKTLPGRARFVRPGLFFVLLATLSAAGCQRVRDTLGRRTVVELDSGAVRLPPGARAHVVRFAGGAGSERVAPDSVRARPGDVVRFIAGDALTHAVAFDTAAMAPAARAFLARTGQVSSPPLIATGDEWVVDLAGAPAGVYPFHCLADGGRGRLVVAGHD